MIAYQLYAELEDYTPKLWRRFQVPGSITMAKLAYCVMTLFEMRGHHLLSVEHERPAVTASGRRSSRMEQVGHYSFPGIDDLEGQDATQVKLSQLDLAAPSRLVVWYDFGDDWRVHIALEKTINDRELRAKDLPRVLEGEGFGILEDCGGPYGLMELGTALKARNSKNYKELSKWMDLSTVNLDRFDLEDMNFRLTKLPALFAKIYEQQAELSQKAINLIEGTYRHPANQRN